MTDKKDYVILGLNSQGLFLARKLARKARVLHCVGRTPSEIGLSSRHGRKYIAPSGAELQTVVQQILRGTVDGKPYAFIGSGDYLDIILAEYPEVFDLLNVVGADIDLLTALNSKTVVYRMLAGALIKTPRTCLLSELVTEAVRFPIMAKWDTKELREKPFGKTLVIRNRDELYSFLKTVDVGKYGSHVVMQEYIDRSGVSELGYGAYYENGKEIAAMVFVQKRQYPMGIASFALELKGQFAEAIRTDMRKFFSSIGYRGFVQVDLLADSKDNEYYVLDVNPRPWSSTRILERKYPGLIEYVIGEIDHLEETRTTKPIGFVRVISDLKAVFLDTKESGCLRVAKDACHDYIRCNCVVDEFDPTDLGPSLALLKRLVGGVVRCIRSSICG